MQLRVVVLLFPWAWRFFTFLDGWLFWDFLARGGFSSLRVVVLLIPWAWRFFKFLGG
jgi:hypothetical protein